MPAILQFYRVTDPYGWLSNLYRRAFIFEGRTFRSREDAYQFAKPDDQAVAEWLITSPAPRFTAMAGRALPPYEYKPKFHEKKVELMTRINRAFFRQNPDLAEKLLATDTAEIQEASKGDAFWGMGNGKGQNMQGRILMQVRAELRGSPEATPTPRERKRPHEKQQTDG